jgi:hypothetical protein
LSGIATASAFSLGDGASRAKINPPIPPEKQPTKKGISKIKAKYPNIVGNLGPPDIMIIIITSAFVSPAKKIDIRINR